MRPISRREALRFGMLGELGVVVGGVGLFRTGLPWLGPPSNSTAVSVPAGAEALLQPEAVRSRDGVLQVELLVARQDTTIAGQQARVLTYNGTVPGLTWRVRPGDRIEVRLRNELESPTNLHTHGLEVSPQANGDNPFLSIEPGQVFDYRFDLPDDHPPGAFWYHPHRHGSVADQLFGGLYGAVIVEGDEVPVSKERLLTVSDISLSADGQVAPVSAPEVMMGREGDLMLVNGQYQPARDLCEDPVARQRKIAFTMTMGAMMGRGREMRSRRMEA